jgi:hypothetical protein
MSTQILTGRANQIGPAKQETGNIPISVPFLNGNASEAMASSGEGEERNATVPRSSHVGCSGCTNIVHELANAMTAVLINVQVRGWKLPPYSRMKRPVRKIERHAQRGGALLKHLLRRFKPGSAEQEASDDLCGQVPGLCGNMTTVSAQGLEAPAEGPVKLPPLKPPPSAPVSCFPPKEELTSLCDPCTSASFPKEER